MGAAHSEYVTGVMTFISFRSFRFLSASGIASYDNGRLGWKTRFVEGLSASVSLHWVQRASCL